MGALGLVLNALVLFHTRYPDATVNWLCGDGSDVRDEDVARLPPFLRHHINLLDRYSFRLPDLLRGLRPLRTPEGEWQVQKVTSPSGRGVVVSDRRRGWAQQGGGPGGPQPVDRRAGPAAGDPWQWGLGRG
nr:transposase [Streptomyces sp. DpondAA-D4]